MGFRGTKKYIVFMFGILMVQHLDVDHYGGSIPGLIKCALKTTHSVYVEDAYCRTLDRGVFHQVWVGVLLLGLSLGASQPKWGIKHIGVASVGFILCGYALFQRVYLEPIMGLLVGIFPGIIIVRKLKSELVSPLFLSLVVGWFVHMWLDGLIYFWIGLR